MQDSSSIIERVVLGVVLAFASCGLVDVGMH